MHIFWIHSNLTYHMAKQIVAFENIPNPQVILITTRGFEPNNEFTVVKLPFHHNSITINTKYGILWSWLKIVQLFIILLKATHGKRYDFYLPLSRHVFSQILMFLPLCKSFNYYEEGLLYYTHDYPKLQKRKTTLLEKIGYFGLYKGYYDFCDKYNRIYVTDKEAGIFQRDKIILKDFFFNLPVEDLSTQIKVVLVFDALSYYKKFKWETHKKVLIDIFKFIREEFEPNTVLYYKYHPAQYDSEEVHFIENVFNKHCEGVVKYQQLPKEFLIESLLKHNQTSFIINVSSIGLYATRLGHNVYTYNKLIAKYEPQFKSNIDDWPKHYQKSLHYL